MADLTADTRANSIDGDQEGSDTPYSDEDEEAEFVKTNGGSSGQLHTPEEASEERTKALAEVVYQTGFALQAFRKITKQSHTADRLLGCLTPTASMPDRLPFTPAFSLRLASQNRDDHILHLAGLVIETWGMHVRDEWVARGQGDFGNLDQLQVWVTRLGDVVSNRRLYKAYPVTPRSSLFMLRRITDQAKLNEKAAAEEAERAERLD